VSLQKYCETGFLNLLYNATTKLLKLVDKPVCIKVFNTVHLIIIMSGHKYCYTQLLTLQWYVEIQHKIWYRDSPCIHYYALLGYIHVSRYSYSSHLLWTKQFSTFTWLYSRKPLDWKTNVKSMAPFYRTNNLWNNESTWKSISLFTLFRSLFLTNA